MAQTGGVLSFFTFELNIVRYRNRVVFLPKHRSGDINWQYNANSTQSLRQRPRDEVLYICNIRGESRIFLRRGCTRLLLYFNTNKPHNFSFFGRIPVVLENRRSSRGGGGVRTPCTLPLNPPLKILMFRPPVMTPELRKWENESELKRSSSSVWDFVSFSK